MTPIDRIYNHALRILEEVGIDLKHAGAVELVKNNGVQTKGDRAYFTGDQIRRWIRQAPSAFTLHAANPLFNIRIGEGKPRFVSGIGYKTVYEMGTARPTALLDYVRFAKIVHQCGHFSVNGGLLVQPSDVPEQLSHLIMLYAALRASDKCLMATAYPEHRMEEIMEMAAILAGGKDVLERSHRILTLVSSTSPMGLDETAMGSILVSARYNQPLIISPGSAASSTSPIDLEKNVAFATAEALAAIVVAQMARSGIPVILSLQCFGADMKTANLPTGFSDCDLWAKYTAKLARKLNLPSSCGGSYTGAHSISPQKSYENMLTACENGVDLIVHAAGAMENHSTVSYEKWIMDVEIMEMVNNCLTDIEVRDITLNLDLGREVEPVRHFLANSTSLNKCRNIAWTTGNGGNGNIDRGMALDLCYRSISTQLRQMLMEYRPPDLDADVLKRLNRFMSDKGVSNTVIAQLDSFITRNEETLV